MMNVTFFMVSLYFSINKLLKLYLENNNKELFGSIDGVHNSGYSELLYLLTTTIFKFTTIGKLAGLM